MASMKRRKVETNDKNTIAGPKVGPSELASAFALASLASLSPGSNSSASREEESRDVRNNNPPLSPEQRAPGSPQSKEPRSPEERALADTRRVHFAPSTKQESTPKLVMRSRRLFLPPQAPPHPMGYGVFDPRHANPYMNGFVRSPLMHHQPAFHHPQPWMNARVYPPHRLMQPPLLHRGKQWICDYCNVASFDTYEEACNHEACCKERCSQPSNGGDNTMAVESTTGKQWFSGSMSLAIQESDREWLSEQNCFIRMHCVEAFSATEDDVSRASKRGRIVVNQVGIRCRFCSHLPSKEKAIAATSFPTSIGGIYESVKRWQRVHYEACSHVPQDVRTKLESLASANVWVPTTRQYWVDSAKSLGMVDTFEGIRFGSDPSDVHSKKNQVNQTSKGELKSANAATKDALTVTAPDGSSMNEVNSGSEETNPGYIVFPSDMETIPPYVYYLIRQVEPCRFSEADRFVARSKGPVGYPGFQCRHCNGHAGLGKYFPVTAKSLSTNSTSQNIHAHLLKCRKCPDQVKDRLVQLKIEKGLSPRLEPGWRKVFFDKVWGRLHG